MRNVYWYAACLLVVLSVGGGMWFFSQHDEPVKMEPKVAQDILPGGNKAIILLADGEKVDVEYVDTLRDPGYLHLPFVERSKNN